MHRGLVTLGLILATILGLAAGSYWAHWRLTRFSDVQTLRVERLEVIGPDGNPHVVIAASDRGGWVQCLSGEKNAPMATIEANDLAARVVVASKSDMRSLETTP